MSTRIKSAVRALCVGVPALLATYTSAYSQDSFDSAAITIPVEANTAASGVSRMPPSERALLIEDLIADQLDPAVDPHDLFTITLYVDQQTDVNPTSALTALLESVAPLESNENPSGKNDAAPSAAENPDNAETTLLSAQAKFFGLPHETQRHLLESHRLKRQQALQEQESLSQLRNEVQNLEARAETLHAFLDGTLNTATDLRTLLSISLLNPNDLGQNDERRTRVLTSLSQPREGSAAPSAESAAVAETPETSQSEEAALKERAQLARNQIDDQRVRYLSLPADTRRALVAAYERRLASNFAGLSSDQGDAQRAAERAEEGARQAAEEREQTLAIAEASDSEALRIFAAQQAAFLEIKEQQEILSAELSRRRAQIGESREQGLAWLRKSRDLAARSFFDSSKTRDADRMYDEIVAALQGMRGSLMTSLQTLASPSTPVPRPGPIDPAVRAAGLDVQTLEMTASALNATGDRLAIQQDDLNWDIAAARRDAMVTMNDARLQLLENLSSQKRSDIRGFGAAGVAQVKREFSQISLELQFGLLNLPRMFLSEIDKASNATVSIAFGIFQAFVGVMVFLLWRQHGDKVLAVAQGMFRQGARAVGPSMLLSVVIKYLRSIRTPLDWLIAVGLLRFLIPDRLDSTMLRYVWIILIGALLGSLITRLIDAIARRHTQNGNRGALRLRSLRLIVVVIISIVVILAIAQESVGRGAIYLWVRDTCWLLALPTAALLLYWWRNRLDELILAGADRNRILGWCATRKNGPLRYLCLAIASSVFIAYGVRDFVAAKLSDMRVIREAVSVALQRNGTPENAGNQPPKSSSPLPEEIFLKLGPEEPLQDGKVWAPETTIAQIQTLISGGRSAICALVSERGLGKSTFIRELSQRPEPSNVLVVKIVEGKCAEIVSALGKAYGCPSDADLEIVLSEIRKRPPHIICVDDAQRMIRPKLGGLKEFDAMIDLFRRIDGSTVCLAAIGRTAWRYLERARSERIVFDYVYELNAWDRGQIEKMIFDRMERIGVHVRFEADANRGSLDFENAGSREERAQRAFFKSLVDYAEGNPAIALDLWRRSLVLDDNGKDLVANRVCSPSPIAASRFTDQTLFVLRAIIQMELSDDGEVIECTALQTPTVLDALRVLYSSGIVESFANRHRVSLFWYREATRALRRQNLLAA